MNNPCTKSTCQNGGTCFADELGQTKCFCEDDFDGESCEIDQRTTATTIITTSTTEPYGK